MTTYRRHLGEAKQEVTHLTAERDALRTALRALWRVTTGLECPYSSCESELCAAIRQASALLGEEAGQ